MKIRMTKLASGPEGHFLPDDEYEVSESLARSFIEDRACVPSGTPETEASSAFPATKIVVPDPNKKPGDDQGDQGDSGDDAKTKKKGSK